MGPMRPPCDNPCSCSTSCALLDLCNLVQLDWRCECRIISVFTPILMTSLSEMWLLVKPQHFSFFVDSIFYLQYIHSDINRKVQKTDKQRFSKTEYGKGDFFKDAHFRKKQIPEVLASEIFYWEWNDDWWCHILNLTTVRNTVQS